MLDRVRIVLVETSHPGNIGATARAMKNMGFTNLYLVSPEVYPHEYATARASGAVDILENAQVCDSLEAALADCQFVAGMSARQRKMPWPLITPRACAQKAASLSAGSEIALVFGRESSGLTNAELALCHTHVHIPTNPEYTSLNVASAVQILVYECRLAMQQESLEAVGHEGVSVGEMERFFVHLESTLQRIDFLSPDNPRLLMRRLRRLYLRAQPSTVEMNILRGILTATEKVAN